MLTIETVSKKIQSIRGKGKVPHTEHQPISFSREFWLGSIAIDAKHIHSYINSEARKWLKTEDYYAGHIYERGVLKYVIHKSATHDAGTISRLSPVLQTFGTFVFHHDKNYYKFVHRKEKDGTETIQQILGLATDHTNEDGRLQNLNNSKFTEYPQSLIMCWSLEKRTFNLNIIMACVFVFMLLVNLAVSFEYKNISTKVRGAAQNTQDAVKKDQISKLKDITTPIDQVWKAVGGKGRITGVKGDQTSMTFTIAFDDENNARDFIKTNGGNYENGKVVLSTTFTGGIKPSGTK